MSEKSPKAEIESKNSDNQKNNVSESDQNESGAPTVEAYKGVVIPISEKMADIFKKQKIFLPVPDLNQSADILKLDIDCFEELFDYLWLKETIAMGQTCKRLNQVVGFIFNQYYRAIKIECKNNAILNSYGYDVSSFMQFIRKITIHGDANFKHFLAVRSKFHQLREIDFISIKMNANKAECLMEILSKLESLHLNRCEIDGSLHLVLKCCPKLKRLCITADMPNSFLSGAQNDWLLQKYPNLEQLELVLYGEKKDMRIFHEPQAFLQRNPNIQAFLTTPQCLSANIESLLKSKVKLNNLAIFIDRDIETSFNLFWNPMNRLHERGFYNRLHLFYSSWTWNQNKVDGIASLKALVNLNLGTGEGRTLKLSRFRNIEELYFDVCHCIEDLREITANLINLERIYFGNAYLNEIFLLVSHAAALKKIVIHFLKDYERRRISRCSNSMIIDLDAWSVERAKLVRPKKITLYVPDGTYMRTRRALQKTDSSLVRIMRFEAHNAEQNWKLFGCNQRY